MEIKKLPKIIRQCMTIGMIPTSYKASLTYEEQLMWFCKFLEEEVIPTVNNNSQVVEELKYYIEHLDLQDEVNNKLEEMAESGELAEIIAQYLELQGLLCYNTLNDLKNADNLADGSFTKTYGELTYNDGNGAFYKIRELINTDVVDNINIVPLVNYPNLVAERIATNGTTLKIENEMPLAPVDETQYEIIKTENEIDGTLPVSYFENLDNARKQASIDAEDDIIKVGTFNIENENVPYDDQLEGVKKMTKLQNIYNKIGASILGLNEIFDSINYPANNFIATEFLSKFNMVKTWQNILPSMDYGEGIISSLTPSSSTSVLYSAYHSPEYQGYVKNVYSFNNKTISFYCTHLCYNDETTLRTQITELFTAVSSDTSTYKIIVGDFNFDLTEANDYLVSFLNSGFKLVNGGQYITYDDGRDLAIDEIMVSSNINIVSSGVGNRAFTEGLSDHFPLWARLSLGGA